MKIRSFKAQFLDDLLSSKKQQTSFLKGKQAYKVGEQIGIYNQLRVAVKNKPIRKLTEAGNRYYWNNHHFWNSPCPVENSYFAHKLGVVTLTNVYEFTPVQHLGTDHGEDFLDRWAKLDDFKNFHDAVFWFIENVGMDWMDKTYDVLQWQGWDEVYFYAED